MAPGATGESRPEAPFSSRAVITERPNGLPGMECTTNCDMMISSTNVPLPILLFVAALGLPHETLDQARPAAIDVLAHRSAGLRAHGLELMVYQFDTGDFRPFRG